LIKNTEYASLLSEVAVISFKQIISPVIFVEELRLLIILWAPNFTTFSKSSDGLLMFISLRFPQLTAFGYIHHT
jgi:hypothetical protein